jgi:hypothetical protein
VTEPSVVELQQEDYDSVALALVNEDKQASVLAGRDNTAPGLLISGRRRKTYDPHLDQIAPTDIELILKEAPRPEAYDGQYQYMDGCDLGFFYARLPPKIAEHIGVSAVDEKAIYKARLDLTEKGVLRHRMAQRAATRAIECDPIGEHNILERYIRRQVYASKVLWKRSSNAAFDLDDVLSYPRRQFSLALVMLTATNGSVHLAAWQFEFATITEKWLWRSSCICIAVFALPVVVLTFLVDLGRKGLFCDIDGRARTYSYSACTPPRCLLNVLKNIRIILLAIGLPAYVFARVFLVIESFISLRHVPIGVYAAVPWSNYIPHF